MAIYESDITRFLNKLKQEKPQTEAEQLKGRAIWWEKQPLDLEERRRAEAASVKPKAYAYFS